MTQDGIFRFSKKNLGILGFKRKKDGSFSLENWKLFKDVPGLTSSKFSLKREASEWVLTVTIANDGSHRLILKNLTGILFCITSFMNEKSSVSSLDFSMIEGFYLSKLNAIYEQRNGGRNV